MNPTNYVFPNDLHVHWSLMIVLYPYITGIIAGAFIVSSLYHVFGVEKLKPVSRFSLVFALAFLACATMPLLLHLGHPERNINMMITPNPSSAMAGFGYIYMIYGVILLHEILFIYRPLLVGICVQASGLKKILYTVLTFAGSTDVSQKAIDLDNKVINFLAKIGIPMACILHGYVGFIFGGVKAGPTWSTPLMPVIFLLSACVSGIAGIILFYVLIRKFQNKPIDIECLRTLTNFLAGFFIIAFVFEMLEIFSHSYLRTEHYNMVEGLLHGPLHTSFWIFQVYIFSCIPLLLFGWLCLTKVKDSIYLIAAPLVSFLLLMQVVFMRWNVVIGGQLLSKSNRGYTSYHAEILGREGVIMAILVLATPFVILFFLEKVFPFWVDDSTKEAGS